MEVNINATDDNFYNDSETPLIVGAYEGSTKDESGKVITKQTINPEQAEIADEFYNMEKGTTTLHETLESYIGGKESPGISVDQTKNYSENSPEYKAYKNAHDKAMEMDKRYVEPNVVKYPNSKSMWIQKPNQKIPSSPLIKEINNLKR